MNIATTRSALLIANPKARRVGAELDHLRACLEEVGLALVYDAHGSSAEIAEVIMRHRDAVDCIVVAGGDGTVNAAASGLMRADLPFGIVPLGTANDLARTLGIPSEVGAAAAIIGAGHVRRIDVGTVNDRPFFNVASIGIAVDLTQTLTPALKKRLGRAGYAWAALKVLARARRFRAWIEAEGETIATRTRQVAVGNGRHYGGGNVVEATAAIDDGTLDLYSLEFRRLWQFALMLRAFQRGTHGAWPEVRTLSGTAFDVRTRRPRPINADGEIVTRTPARFRIRPGALQVYVPAAEADPT